MRGKRSPKREVKPDKVYGSVTVEKLVNYVMMHGKKETARKIVYSAIEDLASRTKLTPVDALEKALDHVKPKVEVRSKRVGGGNFQVPVQVSEGRQLTLAITWILDAARAARKNTEFYVSLSKELQNAINKEGVAVKKREEVQRMAEANKAFAQFA